MRFPEFYTVWVFFFHHIEYIGRCIFFKVLVGWFQHLDYLKVKFFNGSSYMIYFDYVSLWMWYYIDTLHSVILFPRMVFVLIGNLSAFKHFIPFEISVILAFIANYFESVSCMYGLRASQRFEYDLNSEFGASLQLSISQESPLSFQKYSCLKMCVLLFQVRKSAGFL